MKRTTKKVIFLSSMIITLVTLFATAGRHHRFVDHNLYGHCINKHTNHDFNQNQCHPNHFRWNSNNDSINK